MNYIAEIKSFYRWLGANPLKSPAIALWHALMSIASDASNGAVWQMQITPSISTLQSRSGLGKDSIIKARNQLKQTGRVDWRARGGNLSATYIIIPFASEIPPQTHTQTHAQTHAQIPPQTHTQTAPIYKLNKTIQSKPPLPPLGAEPNTKKTDEPDLLANVPDDLRRALVQWRDYKRERRQAYKPKGWAALVQTAVKYADRYGVTAVAALIEECAGNGYQGVIWDRLSRGTTAGSGVNKPVFNYQQHGHGHDPKSLEGIGINLFEERRSEHGNVDNYYPGQTAGA